MIGAGISYLINTYIMVVEQNGYYAYGFPDTVTTGPTHILSGGLFWGLLTLVVFGLWGYWRAVGRQRMIKDIRSLPSDLMSIFRSDGKPARVHLLWGAAGSLLVSQLLLPASCAVLGIGAVAASPSVLGKFITGILQRVIGAITGRVSPTRGHEVVGTIAVVVGIGGAALALLISSLISDHLIRFVLMAVTGGAAFLLGRSGAGGPGTAAGLIVLGAGGLLALLFGHSQPVHADDGGWLECGMNLSQWISSCPNNTGDLMYGAVAVPPAIVGTAVGAFLGSYAGSLASGGGPWWTQQPSSGPSGPDRSASKALRAPAGHAADEMRKSRVFAAQVAASQPAGGVPDQLASSFAHLQASLGLAAVPVQNLVPVHAAQVVAAGKGSDLGYTIAGTAHSMFGSTREAVAKRRARELAEAFRKAREREAQGPPNRRLALLRPAQAEYGGLGPISLALFMDLGGRTQLSTPVKEEGK